MLRLFGHFGKNEEILELLWQCLDLRGATQALANGFHYYSLYTSKGEFRLVCDRILEPSHLVEAPQSIAIEKAVLDRLSVIAGCGPNALVIQQFVD